MRVILAPWLWMLRPAKAASCLISASPRAFWLSFAVPALLLALTSVGLLMVNETVRMELIMPPAGVPAATMQPFAVPRWEMHIRGLAEVWANWHRAGPIGPAEALAVGIPLLILVCVAFGAWLHLVTVHEGPSVWGSYKRAFRAVTACLGLLWVLTLSLGALMVLAERQANESLAAGTFYGSPLWAAAIVMLPAGIVLLLAWISAAVRSVRVGPGAGVLAPRCEGCGYDLTHVPRERRCPECGLDVEMSLTPRYSRPGCAWEDSRGPIAWVRASLAVLFRPGVFYRRLRVRTPEEPARRFVLWHYAALGLAGAIWAFSMSVATGDRDVKNLLSLPVSFFLWVPLCAWAVQRTVGAMAVSWALACAVFADPRPMRKVIAYEIVFLWVPGFFTGLLIASFVAWHSWISNFIFGRRTYLLLGVPVELTVIWVGWLALLLLWFWRFYVAIRAVRWANF